MKKCFVFINFKIKNKVIKGKRVISGIKEFGNYNLVFRIFKFYFYRKRMKICVYRCIYIINILCVIMKIK